MAYSVKWIGKKTKRPYLYQQHSYRVPGQKKPKTKSKYIGPLGAVTLGIAYVVKGRAVLKDQSEKLAKNLDPARVKGAMERVALQNKLDQARFAQRQEVFDSRDKSVIWERAVAEEKAAREGAASQPLGEASQSFGSGDASEPEV